MPSPGDIGLVKVHGNVGLLIRIGQWLCGKGFADYEHAFIYLNDDEFGNAVVVQAEPDGAAYGTYTPQDGVKWISFPLYNDEREHLTERAHRYIGTPYSFLDYVALTLHRFGFKAERLRRYIANKGHMICSQLVDQCYTDIGYHLFDDNRWPGYVTPADLYHLEK